MDYDSDAGDLNQVVHIRVYWDHEPMQEVRAQVAAEPDWTQQYGPRVSGLLVAQKTSIVLPPDFTPQSFEEAVTVMACLLRIAYCSGEPLHSGGKDGRTLDPQGSTQGGSDHHGSGWLH